FLPGLDLAAQLVAPGGGAVAPRLDAELPAADRVDLERAGEEVVPQQLERRRTPALVAGALVEDLRAEDLVPVAEHRRLHVDPVAGGARGRVAAAVDERLHVGDADPRRRGFCCLLEGIVVGLVPVATI